VEICHYQEAKAACDERIELVAIVTGHTRTEVIGNHLMESDERYANDNDQEADKK